jgi:hypothetical protein
MCEYLDTLEKAISVIFQLSGFKCNSSDLFCIQKKNYEKFIYMLETNFRTNMEILKSSKMKLKTLEKSMFLGKLIADRFLYSAKMTIFTWDIIPCIKGYVE